MEPIMKGGIWYSDTVNNWENIRVVTQTVKFIGFIGFVVSVDTLFSLIRYSTSFDPESPQSTEERRYGDPSLVLSVGPTD